jgi:hypothetical protein
MPEGKCTSEVSRRTQSGTESGGVAGTRFTTTAIPSNTSASFACVAGLANRIATVFATVESPTLSRLSALPILQSAPPPASTESGEMAVTMPGVPEPMI